MPRTVDARAPCSGLPRPPGLGGTTSESGGRAVSESVKEKVVSLVAERMGVEPDQITSETHFVNDLQSDSLDMAELVIDLEEAFDLSISDEDAQAIETVGQAIAYIEKSQSSQ
ncbi:MAG: acyl carrier protein [Candidatus Brocadiaceae bacterium]|nr:acyl carrier protein [Candidatus Brocadiaceae bacterium]